MDSAAVKGLLLPSALQAASSVAPDVFNRYLAEITIMAFNRLL